MKTMQNLMLFTEEENGGRVNINPGATGSRDLFADKSHRVSFFSIS